MCALKAQARNIWDKAGEAQEVQHLTVIKNLFDAVGQIRPEVIESLPPAITWEVHRPPVVDTLAK